MRDEFIRDKLNLVRTYLLCVYGALMFPISIVRGKVSMFEGYPTMAVEVSSSIKAIVNEVDYMITERLVTSAPMREQDRSFYECNG